MTRLSPHYRRFTRQTIRTACCVAFALLFFAVPVAAQKQITLYTALTTTTPQMPLWAAIRDGWPQDKTLAVEYWKNLDDLRGIMLAGKGDVWVGNIESFVQAALRGAPVTLVAVSGWKKFYFLAPQGEAFDDMTAFAAKLREKGLELAVTPQDGPSLNILEKTAQQGGPAFSIAAMPPQQLMLEILRGTRQYALLPEPLLSGVLAKKPSLHAVLSLEEEFSRHHGGPARMPLAGIAVHTRFAKENPERVRELVSLMVQAAPKLAQDADAAIAVLPSEVLAALGRDVIAASLPRDTLFVAPAAAVRTEIAAYLAMTMTKTREAKNRLEALLDGPFLFNAPPEKP